MQGSAFTLNINAKVLIQFLSKLKWVTEIQDVNNFLFGLFNFKKSKEILACGVEVSTSCLDQIFFK